MSVSESDDRVNASRRTVMGSAAAVAGLALVGRSDAAVPRKTPAGFTDTIVNGLPADDKMWAMVEKLASWCPPSTGSPLHTKFVDMLARELRAAGVEVVSERQTFPYWEPHAQALTIGGKTVRTVGHQPYSGRTGSDGVEAALAYAGRTAGVMMNPTAADSTIDLSKIRGKIAVFDIAPAGDGYGEASRIEHVYPESERKDVPLNRSNPLFTGLSVPAATDIAKAGAIGAVFIWNGHSDANTLHQMQAFTQRPSTVPVIWVPTSMASLVRDAGQRGAIARLTLHATITPDTPVETLWGVLPGATDEVVIINTHTDGTNANEENGGIAAVALAQSLARIPQAQRRKTYVFLMTAAHFSHGLVKGAADWRDRNADIMRRTAACITIEHLGANEWIDDAQGRYRPTGRPSWATMYTGSPQLAKLTYEVAQSLNLKRVISTIPLKGRHPGEGGTFYRAGVPTLAYITTPDYLIAAPPTGGELAKLSKTRFCDEVRMFARLIEKIDGMSVDALKAQLILPPSNG